MYPFVDLRVLKTDSTTKNTIYPHRFDPKSAQCKYLRLFGSLRYSTSTTNLFNSECSYFLSKNAIKIKPKDTLLSKARFSFRKLFIDDYTCTCHYDFAFKMNVNFTSNKSLKEYLVKLLIEKSMFTNSKFGDKYDKISFSCVPDFIIKEYLYATTKTDISHYQRNFYNDIATNLSFGCPLLLIEHQTDQLKEKGNSIEGFDYLGYDIISAENTQIFIWHIYLNKLPSNYKKETLRICLYKLHLYQEYLRVLFLSLENGRIIINNDIDVDKIKLSFKRIKKVYSKKDYYGIEGILQASVIANKYYHSMDLDDSFEKMDYYERKFKKASDDKTTIINDSIVINGNNEGQINDASLNQRINNYGNWNNYTHLNELIELFIKEVDNLGELIKITSIQRSELEGLKADLIKEISTSIPQRGKQALYKFKDFFKNIVNNPKFIETIIIISKQIIKELK